GLILLGLGLARSAFPCSGTSRSHAVAPHRPRQSASRLGEWRLDRDGSELRAAAFRAPWPTLALGESVRERHRRARPASARPSHRPAGAAPTPPARAPPLAVTARGPGQPPLPLRPAVLREATTPPARPAATHAHSRFPIVQPHRQLCAGWKGPWTVARQGRRYGRGPPRAMDGGPRTPNAYTPPDHE